MRDQGLLASTLTWLGFVTRVACDYDAARSALVKARAALGLHTQVGDFGHVPQMLYHLAALAAECQQLERAVRVASSASRMSDEMGTRVWPVIGA